MDVPTSTGQFDSPAIPHYNPMMSYLIDGHNLIPNLQGLSLQDLDDEEQLISLLQEFCRATRKSVEVFFDNAPAGQARKRKYGLVLAHFVRQGVTADQAIEARLTDLGKRARHWTVVSSDRRVQTAARAVHASVISSDTFAGLVYAARQRKPSANENQTALNKAEIDEWLRLFEQDDPPIKYD